MSRLRDWYKQKNPAPSRDSVLLFKQKVIAADFGVRTELRSHWKFKDQRFLLQPGTFCAVPESIAEDYRDLPGYSILSVEEAEKFMDRAINIIKEENSDIVAERERIIEANKRFKAEGKTGLVEPLPRMTNKTLVSPYKLYKQSKASKVIAPKKVRKIKR